MPDPAHEPEVLIQHCLEDRLTEAEAATLLDMMQQDPGLARHLTEHLRLDAMLREVNAGPAAVQSPPAPARTAARPTRWLHTIASGALAASVTLAATWWAQSAADEEATTDTVAVLMREVNAEWEGRAPQNGMPLTPGLLKLKRGLAQIEFYQGARVTLEGPAAFELVSASEARCTQGKLSAHVPPQARGFRIQTPRGTVVDLGTDFGLDLTSPEAQVHVFKGEVELHPDGSRMQPLKEGEAALLAATVKRLAADQAAFASLEKLDERTAESQRAAFEQWLRSSAAADSDPALLVRLDFQDEAHTRVLRNHALHAPQVAAGSIVGCQWTEGRWPGKRALEFRNLSDRVRLGIPGEHEALTLSAWVRVDGLDRPYNSLFMVEGYENGAVHWQITREGRLRLGLAGREGHPAKDHDTPAIITPERFGQWTHLATCVDPAAREVRHYLNGALIARVPRQAGFALRMPMAELGNWNNGGHQGASAVRHLSGLMDEFLLHRRVLTESEIQRLAR